ncbi:hypothetical protein Q3G72_009295 [Acer saccharum]|nr:hypothetical protein Q3G72_009295 [Acer saccharum]
MNEAVWPLFYLFPSLQVLMESEQLKIATAQVHDQDSVLRYKSVKNDDLKLDLRHALALEKESGHEY